jgi:hypothetical protein
MILSTRHGYARALSRAYLSLTAHPPAESSRQAIRRAAILQGPTLTTCRISRKGKERMMDLPVGMRYSTSALARSESSDWDPADFSDASTLQPISSFTDMSDTIPSPSQTSDIPNPGWNPLNRCAHFTVLETFTELVRDDPINAFLSLATITDERLALITPEHIDKLYTPVVKASPRSMQIEDVTVVLKRLQTYLEGLPSGARLKQMPNVVYTPGPRFRGGRIGRFILLYDRFGGDLHAKRLFWDYLVPQIQKGETDLTIGLNPLIDLLAKNRRWNLIIDLFSHRDFPTESPNLPPRLFTPEVLCGIMSAYVATHQPAIVKYVFHLHTHLGLAPTAGAHAYRVQALMESGDPQGARQAQETAVRLHPPPSPAAALIQLAILRGHRTLGPEDDLQERVLADLTTLHLEPEAPFLHALIEMKLKSGDLGGAKDLFGEFNVDFWQGRGRRGKRYITPTQETFLLALQVLVRDCTPQELHDWWTGYISDKQRPVSDKLVVTLLSGLIRHGLVDEAYEAVHLFAHNRQPGLWSIPRGAEVGINSLNTLYRAMAQNYDLPGLRQVSDLMQQCRIHPNEETIDIVLYHIKSNIHTSPADLASIVLAIVSSVPKLRVTVRHIDVILQQAIRHMSVGFPAMLSAAPASASYDPVGGLMPIGQLGKIMNPIIDKLRRRGVRCTSWSLANRLRYEAATNIVTNGVSSATIVWNELMARGFQPKERHVMALMAGFVDRGNPRAAAGLVRLAKEVGIPMTRNIRRVLLNGWGKVSNIAESEAVYEDIRNSTLPGDGLDLSTVSMMIRIYYSSGLFRHAAQLVQTDLKALNLPLDSPTVAAAANALRLDNQLIPALDIISSHCTALNVIYRRLVRSIRMRLAKRIRAGTAKVAELQGIEKANAILALDDRVRPFESRQNLVGVLGSRGVTVRRLPRYGKFAFTTQRERQEVATILGSRKHNVEKDFVTTASPTSPAAGESYEFVESTIPTSASALAETDKEAPSNPFA